MHPTRFLTAVALIFGIAFIAYAQAQANQLVLTGTLQTGIMAPGAETTGVTLTVSNSSYELDLPTNELKKLAQTLSGKQATVKGTLTLKQGVEVKQRRIITVTSLEAANVASQPK
jgi:hypothetical protein